MFSDRIKSASTWWTVGLISTHFLLFCMIQFWVEPKKKEALKTQMGEMIISSAETDRRIFADLVQGLLEKVESRVLIKEVTGSVVVGTAVVDEMPQSLQVKVDTNDKVSIFTLSGFSNWIRLLLSDVSFLQGMLFGTLVSLFGLVAPKIAF